MGGVAAFIVAIAKAFPAARDIYERSVILFYSEQNRKDENQVNENRAKRDAIVDALNQPGLKDETRKNLTLQLVSLNRV